jgi:uncharacterized protein (TIRG00374 family)
VRSKVLYWGNLAIGVAILAYVLHLYGAKALALLAHDPSPASAAAYSVATVASLVCLGWRWGYVLSGLSRPLPIWILTLQRSAAHSLAVLIPSGKLGGDPLRAWLAARAGVPAAHAAASTAVDRSLEIGSSTPFSIVFTVALLQHGVPQLERALVSIVVAAVALAIGAVIAVRRLRSGTGLVSALIRSTGADRFALVDARIDFIEASERATAELTHQARRMLVGFAVGLLSNLLVVLEFVLLLQTFGLPADGIAVVAAIFATGAAHMLPVPAGVGVLEGAQVWLFEMLGYPPDVGLAVGLAVRLRELLWMAPGLIYLIVRSPDKSSEQTRPA